MKLTEELTEQLFLILNKDELDAWLAAADKQTGGLRWVPLGGIPNNVHAVEVMRDSGAALVERATNAIDALLDLPAEQKGDTAATPHEAASKWFGVPPGGLSAMAEPERLKLADNIRVMNQDSGNQAKPTVVIQDAGTGQLPDDFPTTLLSLMGSNKKSKRHQMGVYNAGGAASYAFCDGTIVVSRRDPGLLNGAADEVGATIVRYNPLDPDKFKTGSYEYLVAADGTILRLATDTLPDMSHGTYVKHVGYELSAYARAAHEPKRSLWHLFHAALPNPALPFRIIETRAKYFPGMKSGVERRVINGLLHLLRRKGTADYAEEARIALGEAGEVVVQYFVLNDGIDPDAFTTPEQALCFTLNGQRQDTRDRYWVRRNTGYNYIYKRLLVFIDGNSLTSAAKRQVFASTREASKDSPLTRQILELVVGHLKADEDLQALEEKARETTLADATKSTSDKVKKQLASQIAHLLKGAGGGRSGGQKPKPRPHPHKPPTPRTYDDTLLPEIPDDLQILTDPVRLVPGKLTTMRVRINAKNDFIPKYANSLSVVVGPPLKDHVHTRSVGRLLGGVLRVAFQTAPDAPELEGTIQVALVEPALGIAFVAKAAASIRKDDVVPDEKLGGEPDVEISWHERAEWAKFDPPWDETIAGDCVVTRDPADAKIVTRVDWHLNRNFNPYESVILAKRPGEVALKAFQEAYELPVCWGLFNQSVSEWEAERTADAQGQSIDVPDDYVRGERTRLARAVLLAMEPEIAARVEE